MNLRFKKIHFCSHLEIEELFYGCEVFPESAVIE